MSNSLHGKRVAILAADGVKAGKPVAAICHGPWTLVEAGVVAGRTLTSYPSIRTDLRNAGADLPAFCAELVRQLEQASVGA
jgi:protease I